MGTSNVFDLSGRHLAFFLKIMDLGGITEASHNLGVDLAEGGRMLNLLRRSLGDKLFVRVGRGVTPTEYAIEIVPRVHEHLATLESLPASLEFDIAEDTSRITIAANVTELLDEVILIRNPIKAAAPMSRVRFLELGSRDSIEPMLDCGDVDMVITVRAPEYSTTLNGCAFASDKHVVFYDPACRGGPSNRR